MTNSSLPIDNVPSEEDAFDFDDLRDSTTYYIVPIVDNTTSKPPGLNRPTPTKEMRGSPSPLKSILKKKCASARSSERAVTPIVQFKADQISTRHISPDPDNSVPKDIQAFAMKARHCTSFVIKLLSNPYSGVFAITGLILLIAGLTLLGVASSSPQAILIALGGAITIANAKIIGGFAIGIGVATMAGLSIFHNTMPVDKTPSKKTKKEANINTAPTMS